MQAVAEFWRRWRWCFLCAAVVLAVVCAGILEPAVWRLFAVKEMPSAFADMEAILSAGDAWGAGYDPYRSPNWFDSYGRPHIYGPGWLMTSVAGLSMANLAEMGFATALLFLGALGGWYRPTGWRSAVVVLAVLLSSPVLLGLERANNDLLMVVLLAVAAMLAGMNGVLATAGVIVLMAAAAWLKLYPVYAAPALLALPGGWKAGAGRLVAWAALTAAGFALYADDYARLIGHIPDAETIFAFDLKYAVTVCWHGIPGIRVWSWAGTLVAAGGAALCLRSSWRGLWEWLPLTGGRAFFTVGAAAIWVGCVASNPSFPYRAVWLLPLLAWAGNTLGPQEDRRRVSRALLTWVVAFLWIWWCQWQGNALFEAGRVVTIRGWVFIAAAAHSGVVITTLLLGWLLLGWAWRRAESPGFKGRVKASG
jgi:hypothetical protein